MKKSKGERLGWESFTKRGRIDCKLMGKYKPATKKELDKIRGVYKDGRNFIIE